MRTKTINLYTFDELSEDAKKKVVEANRYVNVCFAGWYEPIIEEWEEKLEASGFSSPEIKFSGFGSQGDGACFDGTINLDFFCKEEFAKLRRIKNFISAEICRNSFANHYSHEKTRFVDVYIIDSKHEVHRVSSLVAKLQAKVEKLRLSLSKDIYKALENAYESLTSDESVIDTIKASECEFTEDRALA